MSVVPVVDISGLWSTEAFERQTVAGLLDEACKSVGFLIVTGHRVPRDLRERMYSTARAFFDCPHDAKARNRAQTESAYRGYTELATEALAKTVNEQSHAPDMYEAFTIGRPDTPDDAYHEAQRKDFFAPNIWPAQPADFKTTWIEYYQSMEALARQLMRGFALGLGLEESHFDCFIDRHISNMRAINYPEPLNILPGQARAGAHTDYGSLTILYPDAAAGGLQVWTDSTGWQGVPYVPDALVINIGDLMARWTNDRWVSTLHRVVNPEPDLTIGSRRQSIAFFHQPNYDARIECIPTCTNIKNPPRYRPILSGDHLRQKTTRQAVTSSVPEDTYG